MDIREEISSLVKKGQDLMDQQMFPSDNGPIWFLDQKDRQRLHDLKMMLPSHGHEKELAKKRIAERIMKRHNC